MFRKAVHNSIIIRYVTMYSNHSISHLDKNEGIVFVQKSILSILLSRWHEVSILFCIFFVYISMNVYVYVYTQSFEP